jgi:hypothetical protein
MKGGVSSPLVEKAKSHIRFSSSKADFWSKHASSAQPGLDRSIVERLPDSICDQTGPTKQDACESNARQPSSTSKKKDKRSHVAGVENRPHHHPRYRRCNVQVMDRPSSCRRQYRRHSSWENKRHVQVFVPVYSYLYDPYFGQYFAIPMSEPVSPYQLPHSSHL